MDTRQIIARFEAERQALALMDHPHIAKVFDAGATQSGRPFFVMELVKGIPVTEFCDQCRLSTRQRLELFVDVCHAIQHAHQKGIIHRDLKPSNVLVTLQDGKSLVKVIDFGIAKVTGQQLTDRTLFTGFGQLIGTPLYMSPEQAATSAVDVDTRSDVYSLGVLLYELLTGTTPFTKETLSQANFDEFRRLIRETEPPRPSARVSTLQAGSRSTIAVQRSVDPHKLSHQLRGELDWIVMKCLEKDRARRYESASAFAADIGRYLHEEPVQARAPSAMYILRKFVRRNRARIAALSMISALGIMLTAVVGWQAVQRGTRNAETAVAVTQALDETDRWEKQAKWQYALAAARRAQALVQHQEGAERLKDLVDRRVADLVMVLRLEEIRLEMDVIHNESFDWSLCRRLNADAFRNYGIDVEKGDPAEIAHRLPTGPIRAELVAALDYWAKLYWVQGDHQGANRLLKVAAAADPDPWRRPLREALMLQDLEALMKLQASPPLDDPLHPSEVVLLKWVIVRPEVWDVLLELQHRCPNDFWLNLDLARHYAEQKPPQWNEAVGFYRAALALRPESIRVLNGLGIVLLKMKRFDDAIVAFKETLRIQPDFVFAYNNLGNAFYAKGALDEAEDAYQTAIRLKPDNAEAHNGLGGLLCDGRRDYDGAIRLFHRAIELQPDKGLFHCNLGNAFTQKGKLDEAIAAYRAAVLRNPKDCGMLRVLGDSLAQKGALDEAIAVFEEAILLQPDFAEGHNALGNVLKNKGALDEAIRAYQNAIRYAPDDFKAHINLCITFRKTKAWDEAIAEAIEAIRCKPDLAVAHCNLGLTLRDKGRLREALASLQRGHELGSKTPGWSYPSARWVEDCRRLIEREDPGTQHAPAPGQSPLPQ